MLGQRWTEISKLTNLHVGLLHGSDRVVSMRLRVITALMMIMLLMMMMLVIMVMIGWMLLLPPLSTGTAASFFRLLDQYRLYCSDPLAPSSHS